MCNNTKKVYLLGRVIHTQKVNYICTGYNEEPLISPKGELPCGSLWEVKKLKQNPISSQLYREQDLRVHYGGILSKKYRPMKPLVFLPHWAFVSDIKILCRFAANKKIKLSGA